MLTDTNMFEFTGRGGCGKVPTSDEGSQDSRDKGVNTWCPSRNIAHSFHPLRLDPTYHCMDMYARFAADGNLCRTAWPSQSSENLRFNLERRAVKLSRHNHHKMAPTLNFGGKTEHWSSNDSTKIAGSLVSFQKKVTEPQGSSQPEESMVNYYKELSSKDLLRHCTTSKQESVRVQQVVGQFSDSEVTEFIEKISPRLSRLCVHKYGNFVVQRLLPLSESFLKKMESMFMLRFMKYSSNEYSSRVMQACVELSPGFRALVLQTCIKNLSVVATQSASTFLLGTAIKSSPEQYWKELAGEFASQPEKWLSFKYTKRVLLNLARYARAQTTLDDVLKTLMHEGSLVHALQDKHSTQIVLALLEQLHPPTLKILKAVRSKLPEALLSAKYFSFFADALKKFPNHVVLDQVSTLVSAPTL